MVSHKNNYLSSIEPFSQTLMRVENVHARKCHSRKLKAIDFILSEPTFR